MSKASRRTRETVADQRPEPSPAIPWPEWTDAELNTEKWDLPKNGGDGLFMDPEPRVMPPSIEPYDWKRRSALENFSSNAAVFTPSNEYPDFVKNNKHILHSEFVRWFISTLTNLQYLGRNGLRVEGGSPNFTWLGESRPWQGWMYIYSMNKTGSSASQQHQPVVNPHGKYVVRLYFMGFWRRLVVDDMIPVDQDDTPLLPRTDTGFDLWPMLLAKAMMKLAALSWTSQREIRDYYPISCFTGWICLPLITKCLSPNEKWDLLTKYTNAIDEVEPPKKQQDPLLPHQSLPSAILIFANLTNLELEAEAIPDITPCWSHPVYIDKLKAKTLNASQARWKLYRYFDWASKHRPEDGPSPAARSLKLISTLRRCGREACVAEFRKEEYVEKTQSSKVEEIPEVEVWADFSKIAPYLEEILVVYKPSDFEYYIRVSNILGITSAESQQHVLRAGSRVKSQATGGKDGKRVQTEGAAPSFLSSLKWEEKISGCRNEPLYMLIDSDDTKFVLIEFCSMPEPNPASGRSYLIVEIHSFFEKSAVDDPVASIKTTSAGATIFEAEPGRHLYRIYFRSGRSYFARILSDTIFHVGERLRMLDLMSLESDRADAFARRISNGISEAFQEFGRPEYARKLRNLYNSYMPREADMLGSKPSKKSTKDIHQLFIQELTKLVKETFSTAENATVCRALRAFFIDPEIGIRTRYASPNCETERNENRRWISTHETAAIRIQSFFRMILVKMYKSVHDPSHLRHSEVVQSLRKIVELFNYSKRESAANLLVRQIIKGTHIGGQPSFYPCYSDLSQVLNIEEWKGVIRNVQPGQWVPVLRVIVNAPTPEDIVHAEIGLVTNLPRYSIRMVNNETHREVTRFVNGVATSRYPHVKLGYTLIGYGWSDDEKFREVEWSVRVTTIKGEPTFRQTAISKALQNPLGSKPPALTIQELSNNYVPNPRNIIGKWIITITGDSLLSLRLSTSYGRAVTVIQIADGVGKILHEATGGSVLVLPAVYLSSSAKRTDREGAGNVPKTRSRSKSMVPGSAKNLDVTTTEYFVLAFIVNGSWPLTASEWDVANEAKTRGTVYDVRYGRTSVPRRGTRGKVLGRGSEERIHGDGNVMTDSSSRTIFQDPLCRLQVLFDAGTRVQVERDRRREMEIAGMKKLWENEEPGRLLRGRELRNEFLDSNSAVLSSKNSAEFTQESPELEEIRTLETPSDLPPWSIMAYVSKDDDEEERWVKTEGDEEMLRNQRAINALDFNQMQVAYLEEEIELLQDQRRRHYNLFSSYRRKVTDWKSLSDVANEKRDSYVTQVRAAMSSGVGKQVKDTNKRNKKQGTKIEK